VIFAEKPVAALLVWMHMVNSSETALPIWHNFCQILKIWQNFDAIGKKFCGLFCQNNFWRNLAYFSYSE